MSESADAGPLLADELNRRVADAARAVALQAVLLAHGTVPTGEPRIDEAVALIPLVKKLVHVAAQADIHLDGALDRVAAALGVSEQTAAKHHAGAPVNLPLLVALETTDPAGPQERVVGFDGTVLLEPS